MVAYGVRFRRVNWDDPASLVAKIEARFPDLPEPEADANLSAAARLAATLGRASEAALVPHREQLVVLVDGLDEYDPAPRPPPPDPPLPCLTWNWRSSGTRI